MNTVIFLIIGLSAGLLGGFVGIGGGVIIVPALAMIAGFDQHSAQGTTLAAMIPPIGILAAYEYYKAGHVVLPAAALIAAGFIAGGFIGAKFAVNLDASVLKKIFGVVLFFMSLHMLFGGR